MKRQIAETFIAHGRSGDSYLPEAVNEKIENGWSVVSSCSINPDGWNKHGSILVVFEKKYSFIECLGKLLKRLKVR